MFFLLLDATLDIGHGFGQEWKVTLHSRAKDGGARVWRVDLLILHYLITIVAIVETCSQVIIHHAKLPNSQV